MRVVVDTNVVVSGTLNRHGPPGKILEAMFAGAFVVLYDDRIMAEYCEVLARPEFGFVPAHVASTLDVLTRLGEYIAAELFDVVLPDATDLPFLEVAATGHADALVTGNTKHFKPTRGRHSVNVVSPADFLRLLTT